MSGLVWHSSFASLTGYSGSSRAFVLGLDQQNVAVRPLFLYGADHDEQVIAGQLHPRIRALQQLPLRFDLPQVVYAPADRFSKNSGAYRIGYTMLEIDRLPPAWVEQANQMDEVWTPSAWGAESFAASGVTRPIVVVPLGIEPTLFFPGSQRTHLHDRTLFVSVFEWNKRKGWDLLVQAYCAAFQASDPVVLVLKIDCRVPAANPLREIAALLPPHAPPITVLYNQPLTVAQLRELYQLADCFVLATHGEGWGMPILEAMACGTPAIATAWSAIPDFLSAENGYPLPITGLEPATIDHPYYTHARWAAPDQTALVELLRHVVANPQQRQAKGRQAAADAQQWTWQRGIARIMERLTAVGG